MRKCLDVSKIEKLGFRTTISLEKGIKQTINEYLKWRSYENNRDYKNLDFVKKIRESVETIIGGKENVFTFNLSDIDEAIEEIIATSIKMKHSH